MTVLLLLLGVALYLFIGGIVTQWLRPDGDDNALFAGVWLPVLLLAIPYWFARGCVTLGVKLVDYLRRPR